MPGEHHETHQNAEGTGVSTEVRALREYVETKFEIVHSLVDRVTQKLDAIGADSGRLIALEAKQEVENRHLENRVRDLEQDQKLINRTVSKLVLVATAASSLAAIVVTFLLNKMGALI